ncbi:MAG: ammonium transporter, partial [Pirellulaceae bacterium]|nr:ammonium transporter [Pirellulaceae bacterium]
MPLIKGWFAPIVCALLMALSAPAFAQEAETPDTATQTTNGGSDTADADGDEETEAAVDLAKQIGQLQKDVTVAKRAGDNAWMMTSCALVLFMTVPGLAMFYGGLVRKKNVMSVMMQCIFLMGLMTVVWGLWGYSLSFGGANPYIGNGEFMLMNGVSSTLSADKTEIVVPQAGDVPRFTHMTFQGMFFIITPALICGAFAERMKFSAMAIFCVLWGTFVYCPLCHWVWGGGILAHPGGWAGGALDFAGGTVVHISSGVSALVAAILIGKRLGFGSEPMPPHNLAFTTLGAGMLWVGWFGFNAGSAVNASDGAASAFVVTHFSAAAGAVAWPLMEWITRGKPSVLGAASGAVAGLVCITPAAGYVAPMPAFIMGAAAGVVCFYGCTTLKSKLGYDDSLDAFGVHGLGGTLGAVLTGVFATCQVAESNKGADGIIQPLGLIDGAGVSLLIGQVVAVLVTWVFAAVVSFVLLKIIDVTIGLRASQEEETQGLDLTQHG